MRYIRKIGNGGFHINHANNDPPKTSEQAISRWSRFAHKAELSNLLENEQYGLCAYSELRPDQSGLEKHIEHGMSLPDLATIDLIPHQNKLSPFFTATRQRFAGTAEQVLRDKAPELV